MTTMYHGSRDGLTGDTLRAGCCLTRSAETARCYAGQDGAVYEVVLDLPPVASERQARETLETEGVAVGEYLWEAIDEHISLLGEHWDAVRYLDMDPHGQTHECVRVLIDVPAAIRRMED